MLNIPLNFQIQVYTLVQSKVMWKIIVNKMVQITVPRTSNLKVAGKHIATFLSTEEDLNKIQIFSSKISAAS